MAGEWTSERFPQFEMEIRRLIEQHRDLKMSRSTWRLLTKPAQRATNRTFNCSRSLVDGREQSDRELFETTFEPDGRLPTGFARACT